LKFLWQMLQAFQIVNKKGSGIELLKLDHVVYFTKEAPEDIVSKQQAMGNHAVIGGSHVKWGTRNALMYTKNAYVEWLSVEYMDIAQSANHQLVEQLLNDLKDGEGWGTICLAIQGIDSFKEEIENKGFRTSGVLNAERKTADGRIRKWKMLFVDQPITNELPMPFFIEWESNEEARYQMLREEGTILSGNEKLEITECIFSVSDPLKESAEWAILLSQKVGNNDDIILPNTVLKFVESTRGKDRLSDVRISQA
jgi:hypothetical protein